MNRLSSMSDGTRTSVMRYRRTEGSFLSYLNRTRYDYRTEVGDAATNSIVVAVVGWVARNFPEAPVTIHRISSAEDAPSVPIRPRLTGPGRMLQLIERPNPYYSGVVQWMATMTDYMNTGNGYWIKVRGPMRRVEELWWAPSWMIEPGWDADRTDQYIGWYEYTIDGVTYVLPPNDVVHFRDGLDPHNTRKGLSRLAALYREVFTDDEASNLTASLMRNLGVPGIIISPSNTTGAVGRFEDPEQVKRKFVEKFGGDKSGEPMIMTVPSDVKQLSWSPEQMNLRELRKIPEERISAVLGVPAIVAGLGAGLDRSTFSNFGEARKAAYQESIIPAQRNIAAELEVQLLPEFGDITGLDVSFDWRQATAMQENADQIWKRAQEAATRGLMTRANFKRMTGQPVEGDTDDVYVLPSNFLFVPLNKTPQSFQEPTKPRLLLPEGEPR
jgi:HK97 family phage portal protein